VVGAAGAVGRRLVLTEARGASNAKAKRVLGWQPSYTSWRDGFGKLLTSSESSWCPETHPKLRHRPYRESP